MYFNMRIPLSGLNLKLKPRVEEVLSDTVSDRTDVMDDIVIGPDGSLDHRPLEDALICSDGLRWNQRVDLKWCKRARGYTQNHPVYETVVFSLTIKEAKALFEHLLDRPFVPPEDSYAELARRHRPHSAGWPMTAQASKELGEAYMKIIKTNPGARVYPVKCWE